MRQYKIWNIIDNPSYKTPKSFGANEYAKTSIKVGSSSSNSFDFLEHEVKTFLNDKGRKVFQFWVDDVLIKEVVQKTKDPTSDMTITEDIINGKMA
tara:strand:- start:9 stop:296 length:288 start_codon:yes stop_codon:yes gene_type:complete